MYNELMALKKKVLLERLHAAGITWANMRMSKEDMVREIMKEQGRIRENEWYEKYAHMTL